VETAKAAVPKIQAVRAKMQDAGRRAKPLKVNAASEKRINEMMLKEMEEVMKTLIPARMKLEELMQSNPQLIANPDALQDPWKRAKIENIGLLMKGALTAEALVGLKMNIPQGALAKVTKLLPSITAPTVANLHGTDWLSVEIVVAETLVRDLIPKLVTMGAEGIIEYPLNKVI
jgi:ATP phosphoribosyltransferase